MVSIGSASLVPLGLTGCGGGGGGGGGSGAGLAAPTASATALAVAPGTDGSTVLDFTLVDPTGDSQVIEVEYSEDRGMTFQPATLTAGAGSSFTVETGGGSFSVSWNHTADLTSLDQSDLVLRVTPTELSSGREGDSGLSSIFGVGDNTAPTVSSIVAPSGVMGGIIDFDCTLADVESDAIEVAIEYSLDDGSSWQTGTPGPDAPAGYSTSPGGTTATVSWNAEEDEPGASTTQARVRFTAVDLATGTTATSGSFQVHLYRPAVNNLTIGTIPRTMNGSMTYTSGSGTPASFLLRVPTVGAQFTVETSAASGGGAVLPNTLVVTCDADIPGYPAGTDLSGLFSGDASEQSWTVGASEELPVGTFTITARVWDEYGNSSQERTYTIETHAGSGGNRPFDWEDTWYLQFDADLYTITSSGTTSVTVSSALGANGVPDLVEDLRIAGLMSANPSAAAESMDTNGIMFELVTDEILGRLRELFGADFDGTVPGFAPNLEFSKDPTGTTSSIRIGGDDSSPGFALGRAMFDHRNGGPNHNVSPNLGVFTTNLVEFYVNSFYFRQRFGDLMPGIGTPVGEHALDTVVLAPGFDRLSLANSPSENFRYDQIWTGIEAWGRGTSVVVAHEIGHSIGLCTNGAPPNGLFGGTSSAAFAGTYTTAYHIDTPGNNLMAAALSFTSALVTGAGAYQFNELNEAYLREWHLLGL